ncbi:MAG: hypothetical protein QOE83_277 [Actinomycetota bacterium]|nr:hypothetical protein [Actinomycetota bacterium]
MTFPAPSLDHVARLTDDVGIFEHALGPVPRRANGYCTDDNGRALAVACRDHWDPRAARLAERYLAFLVHAHEGGGRFRLRLGYDRRWTDDPTSDDASGRAIFGLGIAAVQGPEHLRETAHECFTAAAGFRSSFPRAIAHAAVGAAEVLAVRSEDAAAIELLRDAAATLPRPVPGAEWVWPEPRLAYANALIPEALIATGAALDDDALLADGLRLLTWLVEEETDRRHERFSFTPTGGRGPDDLRPAFDQQPIEAASFAEACARAFIVTKDAGWLEPLRRSVGWFLGENDAGVALFDPSTGGGADGLHADGINRNQGAESTLMLMVTLQLAQRFLVPVGKGVQAARTAASAAKS